MDQSFRLRREQALPKDLGFALDALGKRHGHCALHRIDGLQRGHLAPADLAHLGSGGVADSRRRFRRAQALVALARLGVRAPARGDLRGKLDRASQQFLITTALDHPVDDSVIGGVGGRDRIAKRAHLHSLLHTC